MKKNRIERFTDYIEFDLFYLNREDVERKYYTPNLLAYQLTAAPYNSETLIYLEDMMLYYVDIEKYEYAAVIRDEINYRKHTYKA